MTTNDRRLTEDLSLTGKLRLAAESLGQDAAWSWRHLWLNVLAGSDFMPRLGRYLLYRRNRVRTSTPNIFSGCRIRGGSPITIGPLTFVNHGCVFEANAPIEIGRECHIAMEVLFVTSDHVFEEDQTFAVQPTYRGISVGDRCWIGARATVLPGVRIEDDVVVAAGSVVTKDCAAKGLYGGVPARRLRDLTV